MSLLIKESQPRYELTWRDKKGEAIEVAAPTEDEAKDLFTWLAQETGMKPSP